MAGGFGTALGSWVKVFSTGQDQFWIAFIGQTIVASSQCFILSVPARLAAVWFGPDQVSSACSIGVFGNQVSKYLLTLVVDKKKKRLNFDRSFFFFSNIN